MPSLKLNNRLIWFAHCPKAGGTSVEKFMVEHWGDAVGHLHWGWDIWWKNGGWRQNGPLCSPQHLIWKDACEVLPDTPDASFAVIRDPLARIVSEYRYQRFTRRGTVIGRLLAQMSFSTWLRVMIKISRLNPYAFDNHLRPQRDFLPEGAQLFRLEDGLSQVAAFLAKQVGMPAPSGTFRKELATPDRCEVKIYRQDIFLILKAYSEDYDALNYNRPLPHSFSNDPSCGMRELLAKLIFPAAFLLERCGKL